MNILIIGGAGMLGAKLVARLCKEGRICGQAISKVVRHDVVLAAAPPTSPFKIETHIGDLSEPGEAEKIIADRPDLIFHLAAVVSGEAEADFEKGYRINLDGTRFLIEAIRKAGGGYCPRLVFTSSIAVFGSPFPDAIGDEFLTAPLTSYGTQKAVDELLISDYSRRGFLDGMALRMPTVCVRPGKPNKAASGFFSNIIREPLNGIEAVLPVDVDVRHWHASPRAAVGFLVQAAEMGGAALGARRALTLPGLSCTVGEQIEALRRVAGDKAVKLIKHQPDDTIRKIVSGWPRNFDAKRAHDLGFRSEKTFDEIIRVHIEDELGGKLAQAYP
ncbi:MAG: SDR family oxidoreductase [Proteobacteria bacterium]|nr:SDR family oxidoreductase [Pseudomonadota bacterium]